MHTPDVREILGCSGRTREGGMFVLGRGAHILCEEGPSASKVSQTVVAHPRRLSPARRQPQCHGRWECSSWVVVWAGWPSSCWTVECASVSNCIEKLRGVKRGAQKFRSDTVVVNVGHSPSMH